jgi:hypothetical protein
MPPKGGERGKTMGEDGLPSPLRALLGSLALATPAVAAAG